MSDHNNKVRAVFHVKKNTDMKRFREGIRNMFNGEGEDLDYVLNSIDKVVCGHDSETQRGAARARWDNFHMKDL